MTYSQNPISDKFVYLYGNEQDSQIMAKGFSRIVFFLMLLHLFSISCEKQHYEYLDKYLGSWKFDVSKTHVVFNNTQLFHDTIVQVIYFGEIKYGSGKSSIIFQSQNYTQEFMIDKDGNLIPTFVFGNNYSEWGGFEGENIFKYSYSHQSGGTPYQHESTYIYGTKEY